MTDSEQNKQQDDDIETQSAENRYAYTLQKIVQSDRAWCLINAKGDTVTLDFPDCSYICIWPDQAAARHFALMQLEAGNAPYEITGEELRKQMMKPDPDCQYAVYPTEEDLWIASPADFLADLEKMVKPEQI